MPKMKTNRGAAKRIRRTKTGKFKRNCAYGRHLLTRKSPKRKRNLRSPKILSQADMVRTKRLLPYG